MGDVEIAAILGLFDRPRTPREALGQRRALSAEAVLDAIDRLVRLGFLVPEAEAKRLRSRLALWRHNLASAQYHVASRDLRYVEPSPGAVARFAADRIALDRRPARFKRYRSAAVRSLPAGPADAGMTLSEALRSRRTVRAFRRAPVAFADFARVVQGTWGKTGELDAGLFGRLTLKTSPSGGALHPIEAYVVAWNVDGRGPGR
jgi:hypothetical protein